MTKTIFKTAISVPSKSQFIHMIWTISVCGIDGPDAKTLHATIKMMTADTKKICVVTPVEVHGSTDDFGAKTCRTIVRGLDKETRAQDVLIGIKCTRHNTGKCRLDQVIVQ